MIYEVLRFQGRRLVWSPMDFKARYALIFNGVFRRAHTSCVVVAYLKASILGRGLGDTRSFSNISSVLWVMTVLGRACVMQLCRRVVLRVVMWTLAAPYFKLV